MKLRLAVTLTITKTKPPSDDTEPPLVVGGNYATTERAETPETIFGFQIGQNQ